MELSFEALPGHLRVTARGAFDLQQARAGLAAMVARCLDAGLDRILVDGRGISTPVSIAERYDLATSLAAAGTGIRMAIVVSTAHMFTKTLEDTALNRGVAMRTTDSMKEALEFLQIEAGPE
jgi:hypothetical protein